MTRIAVLDRHPAVRAGLRALFEAQPGLASAGCVADARDLLPLLYRADPDVLIVDRLEVVRRAKLEAPRTRVLLYVADPAPEFLLAAEIAGADGVIDKAADTHELLRAVRGERVLPARRTARAGARGGAAGPARPPDLRHAPGRHIRRVRSRASSGSTSPRSTPACRRSSRSSWRRAPQRSPERQHAVRLADGGEPAASYMRRAGTLSGKTPTSSASKPCSVAQPAHASQSARGGAPAAALGRDPHRVQHRRPGVVAGERQAEPVVVAVGDDVRPLLLARLRERRPRRPPLLRQARLALVGAAEPVRVLREGAQPQRLHPVGLVREDVADVHSGSRPPALSVFIVNCDVMRASPGRSANVLIRKCSYASASATATRIR